VCVCVHACVCSVCMYICALNIKGKIFYTHTLKKKFQLSRMHILYGFVSFAKSNRGISLCKERNIIVLRTV
jgi:hypothetical protein